MTDTAVPETVEEISVIIDGKAVAARKGELVIEVAERAGVTIPRFCYHSRMDPVGMCRMCIVEIDTGRGPALQPSCMIECTPDMLVDTQSEVTKKAQDGVLEFLLINHPLDCPVCDKGGECPLQDQTMAHGPGESRFVEEKRHNEKPIPVSDLVLLDRERCILCDRCTRFAKDVAGDPLIHFIHRGSETEINTFPDEPFSSYFSGNTVQICPVGALTASSYRFKARPWDLEQAESTCQSCAVGCRVALQSTRDTLVRKLGVDVDAVNWGWLCDKGRFDLDAVHSDARLTEPLVRAAEGFDTLSWSDALEQVASLLGDAIGRSGADGVAVIGGSRLTNEDAYVWAKFAKGCLGTDSVDAQLGDGLPAETVLGLPKATIDEVCAPGGVVVLATADLKEELPVLFLRLRHAVTHDRVTVIELSPMPTGMTSLAAVSLRHRPGEVGEAARALASGIPAGRDGGGIDPAALAIARQLIADAGLTPTVVVGRQSMAESDEFAADASSSLLAAWPDTRFLTALRRSNVHGALDMGLTPGFLPGRVTLDAAGDWFGQVWPTVPTARGRDTQGILQAAADGQLDVLVLLGADPLSDFPDRDLALRGIQGAGAVVAIDCFANPSTSYASVILPAAVFAEVDGTTTNLEGRVTTLAQKVTPKGTTRTDWMIAAELALRLGTDLQLESVEQIWDEIERFAPAYHGITLEVLDELGGDGVVVGRQDVGDPEATPPAPFAFIPGAPLEPAPLDAYGLRIVASRKLYDRGTIVSHAPALASLAPGTVLRVNSYDFDRLGVGAGALVHVKSARGGIDVELHVDDTVPRGTAAAFWNQDGVAVSELIDAAERVTDVRVDTGGTT